MFDEICVFHALYPVEAPSGVKTSVLQTRSFESKLEEYRIVERGYLERYVRVPEDAEGGPRRGTWEPVAFSGVIKFYGQFNGQWHEFRATLDTGYLQGMIEYAGPGQRFHD